MFSLRLVIVNDLRLHLAKKLATLDSRHGTLGKVGRGGTVRRGRGAIAGATKSNRLQIPFRAIAIENCMCCATLCLHQTTI